MFTGIIKEVGTIIAVRSIPEGLKFTILAPILISDIRVDDSVAVNGVCLTATEVSGTTFVAQAIRTSLEKSTLTTLNGRSIVNLELALRPIDRMGGHHVQGHVNSVGSITKIDKRGDSYVVWIRPVKEEIMKYIVQEGSVALNGVSLTVSARVDNIFAVSIIPHTFFNTSFKEVKVGENINIEVDILAKITEQLLEAKEKKGKEWPSKISSAWLEEKGIW